MSNESVSSLVHYLLRGRGCEMIRRLSGSVIACAAVFVMIMTAVAGVQIASAAHDGGGATPISCTVCHDLAAGQSMGGTQAISKSLMTEFTSHGWTPGMNGVGCTFCHRSALATSSMPNVLSGFTDTTPGT